MVSPSLGFLCGLTECGGLFEGRQHDLRCSLLESKPLTSTLNFYSMTGAGHNVKAFLYYRLFGRRISFFLPLPPHTLHLNLMPLFLSQDHLGIFLLDLAFASRAENASVGDFLTALAGELGYAHIHILRLLAGDSKWGVSFSLSKLLWFPGVVLVYHALGFWFWSRYQIKAGRPMYSTTFAIVWCLANFVTGALAILLAWRG